MANTLLFTLGRELDANGLTVSGAKAYFYESGTTTPITAYSDSAATVAHPSPLVADAGGLFAAVYITGESAKVVITKADDTALRTIDPCPVISVGGVGASGISFSPTVDIPETNVQDAIEAAAASAASGFAAYGLGVTGNAPDLANIDATNIGVGQYRTTASTTGTFPTGITASSTSIVRLERETSALAVMTLLDDSGKVFQRFMVASSWGAWRHIVTMPASPTTGDLVHWNGTAWAGIAAGAAGTALLGGGTGVAPAFGAIVTKQTTDVAGIASATFIIPATATTLLVSMRNMNSATGSMMAQLGKAGPSWVATGYQVTADRDGGDINTTTAILFAEATNVGGGVATFVRDSSFGWSVSMNYKIGTGVVNSISGLRNYTAGDENIDRIRVITTDSSNWTSGTITFVAF